MFATQNALFGQFWRKSGGRESPPRRSLESPFPGKCTENHENHEKSLGKSDFGPPKLIPRTRKIKIRRVPLARHKITNQNTLFPENPRHRPRGLRAMLRDWGARENSHLIGKIATYVFPKKWIPHRDSPRTSVGSRRRVRHGAFAPRFYAPRPLWLGALTGRAHWQSTLLGVLGIGVLP